jgi:hypothetical protein
MAQILLAEKHPQEAQAAFGQIYPTVRMYFPRFRTLEANIRAALGDQGHAVQLLERTCNLTILEMSNFGGDPFDFWLLQTSIDYSLGKLYEGSGNMSEARAHYQKSLQAWEHADKDYPPYVDAKQQMTRLMK